MIETPNAHALTLSGELTLRQAAQRLAEGRALAKQGNVVVDFSAVTAADSAALALLFDWQRTAQAAGHRIAVSGLPASMRSLAELYGVAELLPGNEAFQSI